MIFITGDIHGNIDIKKLTADNFTMGGSLGRNDYLIICGDFGLRWDNSPEEHFWLKWLDRKPWTTLWIDGNHENYNMLRDYPVEEWNGARVQMITDNIIHICRGSVLDIDGVRFFAFGGAESHDKEYRIEGKSIWRDELPNSQEMDDGISALDSVGWKVDIVISHTFPYHIQNELFGSANFSRNALTDYFDEIDKRLDFKLWFTGHYHVSEQYDEKHYLIYNSIVQLTQDGFRTVYPTNYRHSSKEHLPATIAV